MNKSKIKGTKFETEIVNYLKDNGYPEVERRALAGITDKGDLINLRLNGRSICAELKNCKSMDLSGWVNEAEKERDNAAADLGIVIHKRTRHGVSESYVTLSLSDLLILCDNGPEE